MSQIRCAERKREKEISRETGERQKRETGERQKTTEREKEFYLQEAVLLYCLPCEYQTKLYIKK